jgi:hypothetical protein
VDGFHSYFVSDFGVLVHNACDITHDEIISELKNYDLSHETKHLNKHLPDTPQSDKLLRKGENAHVFNDKETLSRVEAEILKNGQYTDTVRGTERYGLRFNEPIGYQIRPDGSKLPLSYGELKLNSETGGYHIIPRTGPSYNK